MRRMDPNRKLSKRILGRPAAFFRLSAVLLLAAGCTGVFNDPGVRKELLDIKVADDTSNQYLWNSVEEIKGNQSQITMTGSCGGNVPTLTVDVVPEEAANASASQSFTIPCVDKSWIATFDGTKAFAANGRYRLNFSAISADAAQEKIEFSRIYDFYNVPHPETMVSLQCIDKNSGNVIPTEAGDECNVYTKKKNSTTGAYEEHQRLRIDGSCSAETIARSDQTTVLVNNTKQSCPTFSIDYSNLTTGAHRIVASWQDTWGNRYSRTLLVKVFELIEWYAGGMSFTPAGSFESITNFNGYRIEVAVGSPFQDFPNNDTDSVPFSRPPINGGGSYTTRLAPGYLSLIYGLSDGI